MKLERIGINKNTQYIQRWDILTAPHPETGEKEYMAAFSDKYGNKIQLTLTEKDLKNILSRFN